MTERRFFYLYGITAVDQPALASLAGTEGLPSDLTVIRDGGVQAFVAPTDPAGPDPTVENTKTHERVLSVIMDRGTVIPFAFGSVLPEHLVHRLLSTARAECQQLLVALRGKMEVGLKLIWQKAHFLDDIETPDIARARRQQDQMGPAHQALLGELLQAAADAKRAAYRQSIYEPLAASAVAAKQADLIGPRMVLNASFLIEKSREAEFDRLVNDLCQPYMDRLEIRYSGPWPPYHFVTLRLRVEGEK